MKRLTAIAVVAAWLSCAIGVSAAQAEEPAERAEKLRFDAQGGGWEEIAPPVPGTPEGDFRIARSLFADKAYGETRSALKKWVKAYGEMNEYYPQVMLLRARTLIAQEDYYKAHTELTAFLNEFAGSAYVDEALTLKFTIADVFLSGKRRKILGLRILKADDIGIAILDDIAANYPGTRLAELAIMAKANYYFHESKDFAFAEQEYVGLTDAFPRSRYVRQAMLQSARAALASFNGIQFDDAPLIEAEERFSQYLVQYPGSAEQEDVGLALQDIADQRAAKELSIGEYYERAKHPGAAAFYYRSTVENWPNSIAAIQATERLEALTLPVEQPELAEPTDPEIREGRLLDWIFGTNGAAPAEEPGQANETAPPAEAEPEMLEIDAVEDSSETVEEETAEEAVEPAEGVESESTAVPEPAEAPEEIEIVPVIEGPPAAEQPATPTNAGSGEAASPPPAANSSDRSDDADSAESGEEIEIVPVIEGPPAE